MANGKVLIVMGSDSDFPIMEKCFKMLDKFDVKYDVKVASAHRTRTRRLPRAAVRKTADMTLLSERQVLRHICRVCLRQIQFFLLSAFRARAELLTASMLFIYGSDADRIPVATVAIDGGANSAILACQMIALKSEELRKRLHDYKKELADSVEEKDKALQTKIAQM